MFKFFLILLLSSFLLFSCSKKDNKQILSSEPTEEEKIISIYEEAVEALNEGEAYYAGNKFREVESLAPQSKWAEKASLMASYSEYSRNAYANAIFGLERHIKNYPADKKYTLCSLLNGDMLL